MSPEPPAREFCDGFEVGTARGNFDLARGIHKPPDSILAVIAALLLSRRARASHALPHRWSAKNLRRIARRRKTARGSPHKRPRPLRDETPRKSPAKRLGHQPHKQRLRAVLARALPRA